MPKLSFGRCMLSKSTLQGAFGRFGMDDDARLQYASIKMWDGAGEKWNPKPQDGHGQKQHETTNATENIESIF